MTDEQIEKLKSLASQLFADPANAVKTLGQILTPQQIERLKQIKLQAAGAAALSIPEVAKALALTEEQREKLKTLAGGVPRQDAWGGPRREEPQTSAGGPGRHAREAPCLRRANPHPATTEEVRKNERPQDQPGPFENLTEAAPLSGIGGDSP